MGIYTEVVKKFIAITRQRDTRYIKNTGIDFRKIKSLRDQVVPPKLTGRMFGKKYTTALKLTKFREICEDLFVDN